MKGNIFSEIYLENIENSKELERLMAKPDPWVDESPKKKLVKLNASFSNPIDIEYINPDDILYGFIPESPEAPPYDFISSPYTLPLEYFDGDIASFPQNTPTFPTVHFPIIDDSEVKNQPAVADFHHSGKIGSRITSLTCNLFLEKDNDYKKLAVILYNRLLVGKTREARPWEQYVESYRSVKLFTFSSETENISSYGFETIDPSRGFWLVYGIEKHIDYFGNTDYDLIIYTNPSFRPRRPPPDELRCIHNRDQINYVSFKISDRICVATVAEEWRDLFTDLRKSLNIGYNHLSEREDELTIPFIDYSFFEVPFDVNMVRNACNENNFRSRAKISYDKDNFIIIGSGDFTISICTGNSSFFNIQLKNRVASPIFHRLLRLSPVSWNRTMIGFLRGFIDFVDRKSNNNISRCKLLDFWKEFVQDTSKIPLGTLKMNGTLIDELTMKNNRKKKRDERLKAEEREYYLTHHHEDEDLI